MDIASWLTANMSLEQDELVVRKNVQFGSFVASVIGALVASLKLLFSSLTVNTRETQSTVKDVNISYKDIRPQTAELSDAF